MSAFQSELMEILKLTLPSLVVLLTVYFMLKKYFDNEQNRRIMQMKHEGVQASLPIKLQAYERMTLFLERISPENLIMRTHRKKISAQQLRTELIQTIRNEFDHNITQQIYVSPTTWNLVRNAKEETIKMINICSGKVKDDASGLELSQVIMDVVSKMEKSPVRLALEYLKKEARKNF